MAVGNVCCIDIGSTKICTLVASVREKNITKIIGTGIVPSLGIEKGVIADLSQATQAIKESLAKAEYTAPKVERAWIGFSGRHLRSLNNRVPVTIEHPKHLVTSAAVRRGAAAVQKLNFPQDRRMLPPILRQHYLDGIAIKNPVGMHGFRLDVEAHIITAGEAYLRNLEACLRQARVSIVGLVANPVASSEAVLTPEEKEEGVVLADIGGGVTDIAVFREGGLWHTSVLPIGGIQVSKDVAAGLGVPFSVAEKLKIENGGLFSQGDVRVEKEGHKVSREELCYIIRARVEEILRMVLLELPAGYTPTSMVLTGGMAKLAGLEEFAQEVLEIKVRVGKPGGALETEAGLDDPAYAASIGLLLWGAGLKDERTISSGRLGVFSSMLHAFGLPLRITL
jgi:cell division protein FtsA